MSFNAGGLGAAGTRVTKKLGPGDEIWTYVWQSIVGATALDFVLTGSLLSYLVIGWGALVLWLSLVGFLAGVIVLVFVRPQKRWIRLVFGNLWAIGALLPVIPRFWTDSGEMFLGPRWYAMLGNGLALIGAQIAVVGQLPWWVYVVAGLVDLAILIRVNWKVALVLLVIAPAVGVVVLSDGSEWLQAWDYLKWFAVPYLWPFMGFALLLALVMGKEMLFPSLEWTFKPVSLEELREVGLIGLWAPGLFNKSKEHEPAFEGAERRVRVESKENEPGELAEETYTYLPDSNSARDFYRALSKGATFTISEAVRWSVGRRTFENKIRKVFLDRGWAEWVNEEHHDDQGAKLTLAGKEKIEALVLSDPRH